MNVGNAGDTCWESKLCVPSVVASLRSFISTYSPDILLLAEVMHAGQLQSTEAGGPLLPEGYAASCDVSEFRTGAAASWNASGASHEHECVAWKISRIRALQNESASLRGLNDTFGASHCHYDFTAHAVPLILPSGALLTAVAVHPDSQQKECRVAEIASYWTYLATNASRLTSSFIIGGDWNAGRRCVLDVCMNSSAELQIPAGTRTAYSLGQYWTLHNDGDAAPTAVYMAGTVREWLDHVFVQGDFISGPCTECGAFYNSTSLPWGAVVAGYDGVPRADGGSGCDHRAVLLDMLLS